MPTKSQLTKDVRVLTETNVHNLTAPAGKADHIVWDRDLSGFGVRLRGSAKGTFHFQYFIHGKPRKMKLGKVGAVSLEDAKAEAKQAAAKVAVGNDPALERVAKATKSKTAFGELIPAFLAWKEVEKCSPNYLSELKRSLNNRFKHLHRFHPDDVTRKMISPLLDEIVEENGPVAMTRSRAHLQSFFTWGIQKGYVEHGNPVSGTLKFDPAKRDRQHTEKELALIWKHSDDDVDFDVIQKLIALTGARRSQIGSLKRKEVDREARLITLKGQGRSKNGETFLLPISKQALVLLDMVWDRRDDKTGYLFGEAGSKGGFSGWSKTKPLFEEKIAGKVDDYWLHDFRRTFENLGQQKCGLQLIHLEACMNHLGGEAKKGVRAHYNFQDYVDEKIDAMDKWGNFVEGIVGSIKAKPNLKMVA
jgi:integrase